MPNSSCDVRAMALKPSFIAKKDKNAIGKTNTIQLVLTSKVTAKVL